MTEEYRSRLQRLQYLNVTLRRQWEIAETFLPEINRSLEQLAQLETTSRLLLLGPVLSNRPYNADQNVDDSGQVTQAALSFPGGLGVVFRDTEEFAANEGRQDRPDEELTRRFVSCTDCDKALQTLLASAALPLIDRLLRTLAPGRETPSCRS